MTLLILPLIVLGTVLTVYFYNCLTVWRSRYKDIPSLTPHLLWGNIVNVGKLVDPTRHGDYSLRRIWKLLCQPPCFVIDFRPFIPPVIVIADPSIAEEISRSSPAFPHALCKDRSLSRFRWILGKESVVLAEGEEWKWTRKRYNPGFRPAHLYSLMPLILRKTHIFADKLRAAATSQNVITLGQYVQDLTVDIIGEVLMEYDFQAQLTEDGQGEKGPRGTLTALKKILEWTFNGEKALNPFHRFSILRPIVLRYYSRILDARFSEIIHSRMATRKPYSITHSVLNLAHPVSEPFTPRLLQQTISQVKTFIFAGEDTTSTAVQWMIYNISKHPRVLAKLRAEHDSIFGDQSAEEALSERPMEVLAAMVYSTAVVKETLRLNPPAGTARAAPAGSGFEVVVGGKRVRLEGTMLYVNHDIIHRNEKYWGPTASDFSPERWFSPDMKNTIATGAFRPFERGPRRCIGQELALIEAKVILALTCRDFDFEKVGYDGVTQEEVYDVYAMTHKPVDGMRMRVKFRHDLKRADSPVSTGSPAVDGVC